MHGLFALRGGCIPLFKRVAHAALEILGFSRLDVGLGKGTDESERLVCFASLKGLIDLGKRLRNGGCQRGLREGSESRQEADGNSASYRKHAPIA